MPLKTEEFTFYLNTVCKVRNRKGADDFTDQVFGENNLLVTLLACGSLKGFIPPTEGCGAEC